MKIILSVHFDILFNINSSQKSIIQNEYLYEMTSLLLGLKIIINKWLTV